MGCLGKGQRLSCALHRGVGKAGALCVPPGCCGVVCVPLVGREGTGRPAAELSRSHFVNAGPLQRGLCELCLVGSSTK